MQAQRRWADRDVINLYLSTSWASGRAERVRVPADIGRREPDGVNQARSTPPGVSWSVCGSVIDDSYLAGATTGKGARFGAEEKANLGQFVEANGFRLPAESAGQQYQW